MVVITINDDQTSPDGAVRSAVRTVRSLASEGSLGETDIKWSAWPWYVLGTTTARTLAFRYGHCRRQRQQMEQMDAAVMS